MQKIIFAPNSEILKENLQKFSWTFQFLQKKSSNIEFSARFLHVMLHVDRGRGHTQNRIAPDLKVAKSLG